MEGYGMIQFSYHSTRWCRKVIALCIIKPSYDHLATVPATVGGSEL